MCQIVYIYKVENILGGCVNVVSPAIAVDVAAFVVGAVVVVF